MNSLIKKLILPISLSIFSLNLKSQDYSGKEYFNQEVKEFLDTLPKKFNNYRVKDSARTTIDIPFKFEDIAFQVIGIDLNKDSINDMLLFYPIREESPDGRFLRSKSKYPFAYLFKLDEGIKILFDDYLDGLNYNERFSMPKNKNIVKL